MNLDAEFIESPVSRRLLQKEQTRRRILDMAVALMRNCGEEAVSIRAVATEAEVTERTIYRHFKSREALLQSIWQRTIELIGGPPSPETADALIESPHLLFPCLDRERELVRALVHSRARRSGRSRSNARREEEIIACVREELEYLDERSLRRRAAIAQLIASPYAWEYLEEFWGINGEEAGKAAAEALEILLNRRLAY